MTNSVRVSPLKNGLIADNGKTVKPSRNDSTVGQLNAALGLVSSTIGTVKQICTNLSRRYWTSGVGAAIEWQAEEFQREVE